MPDMLQGKTALVTGSSSGLGRAIALAYAAQGAQVCCVDLFPTLRNSANPTTGKADDLANRIETETPTHEELRARYGGTHVFVRADVTSAGDWQAAVRSCIDAFGRLDVLVNNAGVSVESQHERPLRLHETEERDWDVTMGVNAKGVFLGCKYAIGQMLKQEPLPGAEGERGWIVNVVSIQGLVAYWATPSYCASKGAALQLTKQIAIDYAKDRIHCNSICPGFLKTSMTQNIQNNPESLDRINAAHPLGGMGEPADVARVAVFLASGDAKWVTGVAVPVDGGYVAL
ncbi:NAD(P)-binding protein [Patellaria atrata CBS 101060]|uniref:NAD(P)-binding protein n=1 Tax=Patellaria atrata CBS 101060 TaxID=1346257 RepID=A0A9P4SCR0_9PEZI|nr:NAD(P)-binding protein [Patellaria atrata CBS 101060]